MSESSRPSASGGFQPGMPSGGASRPDRRRAEPARPADGLAVGEQLPRRRAASSRSVKYCRFVSSSSPRARPSGLAETTDRGRDLAVLEQRRLGPAVGPDQAVQAEVAVVRLVAEVAAVGPARRAVRQLLDEAVVPPLPDEAALQSVRGLDRVPVLGQRAVAVAHRVRVLAHDQRVALPAGAGVLDEGRDRRIHRAGEVADLLVARPVPADRALVVERPARVVAADLAGLGVVVRRRGRTRCRATRRSPTRGSCRAGPSARRGRPRRRGSAGRRRARSMKACDSMSASSMTYRPSSSVRSRKTGSLG